MLYIVIPSEGQYVDAGQGMHALDVVAPVLGLYVPLLHAVYFFEPVVST